MSQSEQTAIELYGAPTGNCMRVAIALEEAGIPYDVKLMDLRRGEQHGREHLARNPLGQVPTIIHSLRNGSALTLSQSNAILFYISDLAPGVLLPVDDAALRAHVLERSFSRSPMSSPQATRLLRSSRSTPTATALSGLRDVRSTPWHASKGI